MREAISYEHRVKGWPLAALLGGAAVAIVCGVIASNGTVPGWEQGIFHGINGLPDWLRLPMWVFQLAGLLLVPLVVAVGALVFRRYRLAIALLAFIPLKLIVEKGVVKNLVERRRPGTTICNLDTSCGHFRDVPLESLSFVSGHAIISWGVATLLFPYLPARWRWLPFLIAGLNAIARVYLGAHNPLDVIGGAGIGVAIGAMLTMAIGSPAPSPTPSRATSTPR